MVLLPLIECLLQMVRTTIFEDRLTSGHRLSDPLSGDEVLISGVSGSFPDSDSVVHWQENLFNKVSSRKQKRLLNYHFLFFNQLYFLMIASLFSDV